MIKSFKDRETRKLFDGRRISKIPEKIQKRTLAKLMMLDNARTPEDLRKPPSNHLEKLTQNRKGQMSIRVNDSYRICFKWVDGNAYEVEVVDYH